MTGALSGSRITLLQRIAAWCQAARLDEMPAEVVHAGKRCILDTIGVTLAAARHPARQCILGYARQSYPSEAASVIGSRDRLSPVGAALVNGTAGHLLDFDDTSYTGIMHGSTVVLPAALAATEHAGEDGRRLLEAFVVGSEVAYAVALVCTTQHYYKGWWSTGTFGAIGAAAASARALGLAQAETAVALSLAAIQACGMKAAFGTDAKPYLAGRAAAIGVEAALLAAAGLDGPPAALEDRNGFIQLLNDGKADPGALDTLGTIWRLVEPGILFKQYPVCSGAHAAVELTQHLLREHRIAGDRVHRAVYEVSPTVAISLVHDRPRSIQQAQFSMPFAIGVVLAKGALDIESLSDATLADPQVRAAMEKVVMHRDDSLQNEQAPECARVTLTIDDGREIRGYLGQPTGMPEKPLSDERLREKFLRCADAGGISHAETQRLLAHLEQIELAAAPLPRHDVPATLGEN
ncbi:MAG: MmgE/PrpD family protein [Burkholderiaceae bacterium]|nr:MmgE/PrpD family protein [Burkholderiaceae bacterium]